jgi:hypothetical protein
LQDLESNRLTDESGLAEISRGAAAEKLIQGQRAGGFSLADLFDREQLLRARDAAQRIAAN